MMPDRMTDRKMAHIVRRTERLQQDSAASVRRTARRVERGWQWHWPVSLPFLHAYETVDMAVLNWRKRRLARLLPAMEAVAEERRRQAEEARELFLAMGGDPDELP